MPNQIEKLPDGKIVAKLETGEVFEGDPLEITQKMAEAHVSTKRWGQEWKQKFEAVPPPTEPAKQDAPTPSAEETQLQAYLLDQQAKALGFKNGDEYKAELERVRAISDQTQTQAFAADFLNACQDFPNTPAAIEALSKRIEENGWNFDPQSMIAAHAMLTREHAMDPTKGYAPLTQQQINEQWAGNMQAASRGTPPPMIRSNSPDANAQGFNPWDTKNVKLDDLRSMAIRQELEGRQR